MVDRMAVLDVAGLAMPRWRIFNDVLHRSPYYEMQNEPKTLRPEKGHFMG